MVPATHAIILLQEIMLRGYLPNYLLLIVLGSVGFVIFGLAWWLLRRAMAQI